MMKVALMTELILMPISWLVSKSLDTARMAMPILVFWMKSTRTTTSTRVSTGVIRVTILVVAVPMVTDSLMKGMVGYILERPPVIYRARFCSR